MERPCAVLCEGVQVRVGKRPFSCIFGGAFCDVCSRDVVGLLPCVGCPFLRAKTSKLGISSYGRAALAFLCLV